MQTLPLDADTLVHSLLSLSRTENVSILDSCGVGYLGSHLMIAGIDPVEVIEIRDDVDAILRQFDKIEKCDLAAVFTLSYDFGFELQGLSSSREKPKSDEEPFSFIALFDTLIVHDYDTKLSFLAGNRYKFDAITARLESQISNLKFENSHDRPKIHSNFSKLEYLRSIEAIKEKIRDGDTYQANLTRRITANFPQNQTAQSIFARLRRDHPASFAALIMRESSTVISASPERFFRINQGGNPTGREGVHRITTSPIKGTRPRGRTPEADKKLSSELLSSEKDRAENTMIVDLLRNDLGRVCEYGSVEVEKLCDIEEHPSLFHLVSTVSGDLRDDATLSDILKALFPCGSITGAPKISTMKIIDRIEPNPRGLSMGAIGCSIPDGFGIEPAIDLSVAIRTMVVNDSVATFNVGGGIVIDSDPESEYAETETKAAALLNAMGL